MPPKTQFTREQIVDAAFQIASELGMDGLTVRKVAAQLGSSVAPIYVNFKNSDELQQAVVQKVFAVGRQMAQERYTDDRFLDIGIASIRFAREYPILFWDLLANTKRQMEGYDQELGSDILEEVQSDPNLEGFTEDEVMAIFLKMRVFHLGMTMMVANGMLPADFGEDDQISLLKSAGDDIITAAHYRKQQEPQNSEN